MTKKYKDTIVSCHRFEKGKMYGHLGYVVKMINSHTTDNKYFKDYVEYQDKIKEFKYYYNRVPFEKEGILLEEIKYK